MWCVSEIVTCVVCVSEIVTCVVCVSEIVTCVVCVSDIVTCVVCDSDIVTCCTQGVAGNPVLPVTEFVNSKLTAKTTRQMQGVQ